MSFTGRAPDFRSGGHWPFPRKRKAQQKEAPATKQERQIRELEEIQKRRPMRPPGRAGER